MALRGRGRGGGPFSPVQGGAQPAGGVVGGQDGLQPLTTWSAQGVVAAQQHHLVRPGRIGGTAAVLVRLLGESLSDPGQAQAAPLDQVEGDDHGLGTRKAAGYGLVELADEGPTVTTLTNSRQPWTAAPSRLSTAPRT